MSESNPWEPIFQNAVQFHGSGRLDEAGSLFAAIIEHNRDHFPSLHRLAAIRRGQGRLEESAELLEIALASNPNSADAHNSLANTLNALNRHEDAIAHYRSAVALRNEFPEAYFNLGRCLHAAKRFEEAEAAYRAALALRPGYVEAHMNLGIVLARLNRPAEAIDCFSAALSGDPSATMAYGNIGMALSALNRFEEAASFLQRARDVDPHAARPVFNDAILQLAMGNYERGFRDFEARWGVPELNLQPREFRQPLWDGKADPTGKTIFLWAEQGLGDTILFARFIKPLIDRGARVVLEAPTPLVRLLNSIPGVSRVQTSGDPTPEFDLHLPFGSLPLALKTALSTVSDGRQYLRAPGGDTAPEGPAPRIGVCWAGNPEYANDHNRSIPLESFARLLYDPGAHFVSLQQKPREGDAGILLGIPNIDLLSIGKANDLADTAALIDQLDLVITVDTVVAHLAGALGRPVWILLPFYAHWVWMRDVRESAWYPSARLFRQPRTGDWATVIEDVARELAEVHVSR